MNKVLHIAGAMNIGGTETMLVNLYRKVNNDIKFDFISFIAPINPALLGGFNLIMVPPSFFISLS